ncbi:MAG: hypothetical protein Q9219_000597, partial [cf. Caloplaca sp. 3 TL-2023]
YTLPRYPSSLPMTTPSSSSTTTTTTTPPQPPQPPPSQQTPPTITLHLKSLRPTPQTAISLTLPSLPPTTTIHSLKQRVAESLRRTDTSGIKILHARKPCADSKSLGEVAGGELAEVVEMGVMVMGGSAEGNEEGGGGGEGDVKMGGVAVDDGGEGMEGEVAQGVKGEEVLQEDAFWDDLRGWLMLRVRDEGVVGELWGLWKRAWDER